MDNRRVAAGARITEVGFVLRNVDFEVDIAVTRDVRRDFEVQFGIEEDGLSTGRADDADRDARTLLNARLDVVERHDARCGNDFEETFVFERTESNVEIDGAPDRTERNA